MGDDPLDRKKPHTQELHAQTPHQGLFELIGYMLTSARGLVNEPPHYGPFRLLDGVSRLCALLEKEGGELVPFFTQLRKLIDERKFSVMTDEEEFVALMDELVLLYTKRLKGKEC
jgi:hypothetical protein